MAARLRVAIWGLVLLTAGLLELKCGHKRYDHKKSSEMFCTMIKRGEGWWGGYTDASCFVPDAPCFYAGTIQFLSPRWLGQFSGNGGPLLTWVPLLLLDDGTRRIKSALVTTLVWYLALISIVRHFRTQMYWDPSGHVFVFGAQLAPLWYSGGLGGSSRSLLALIARCWLSVWPYVILYLSIATAAFFHNLSETIAGYLLVLILVWMLEQSAAGDEKTSAPPTPQKPPTAPTSTAGVAARLVPNLRTLLITFVMWALASYAGWADEASPSSYVPLTARGILIGYLVYDSVLWLLLLWLLLFAEDSSDRPQESDRARLCASG